MQMEKDLDLEKAINMARQSEEIKKQQNTLRSDTSGVKQMDVCSVDRVFQGRQQNVKPKFNKSKSNGAKPHSSQIKNQKGSQCHKCGGTPHPKHECPANDAKCHTCGKKGHYQRVCRSGKAVHDIEEEEECFFLGSVTSGTKTWTSDIGIMDKHITFKLATGADVTAAKTGKSRHHTECGQV
ncbi:hypothetical protein ABVT39_012210 [Epinephelus coioides]